MEGTEPSADFNASGDNNTDLQYYDDMAQGLFAEHAALAPAPQPPVHALPGRQYLDATVVPLLLHGLEAIAMERPQDPIEYLAAFLISNNPQRQTPLPTPPVNHLATWLGNMAKEQERAATSTSQA